MQPIESNKLRSIRDDISLLKTLAYRIEGHYYTAHNLERKMFGPKVNPGLFSFVETNASTWAKNVIKGSISDLKLAKEREKLRKAEEKVIDALITSMGDPQSRGYEPVAKRLVTEERKCAAVAAKIDQLETLVKSARSPITVTFDSGETLEVVNPRLFTERKGGIVATLLNPSPGGQGSGVFEELDSIRIRDMTKEQFQRVLDYLTTEKLARRDLATLLSDCLVADKLLMSSYQKALYCAVSNVSSEDLIRMLDEFKETFDVIVSKFSPDERIELIHSFVRSIESESKQEAKEFLTQRLIDLINVYRVNITDLANTKDKKRMLRQILDILDNSSDETKQSLTFYGMKVDHLSPLYQQTLRERILGTINSFPNIEHLVLQGWMLYDPFLSVFNGLKLKALELHDGILNDTLLCSLKKHTRLRSLTLSLQVECKNPLAHLEEFTQLQHLSLTGFRFKDRHLKGLHKLVHLTSLHILQTPISKAGLKHLKGLTGLTELIHDVEKSSKEECDLSNCLPACTIKKLDYAGLD